MNFTPFETSRLRLRPQEAKDAGFALCIWSDPITGKYLTDPALDDIDDLNEYMDLLRHLNDSTDCYYIIRLDSEYDAEATAKKKESIISDRQDEVYQTVTEGYKEAVTINVDEKEWAKVKFDNLFTAPSTSDNSDSSAATE